jgi:hypothetical protein
MSLVVESMGDKFNPGKFLLGGYCNDQFCLARLDFSGSFDTSFNSSGYVIKDIPTTASDIGYSLALQSDGKILLGGTCDNKFCIARFNSGWFFGYCKFWFRKWLCDSRYILIN